MSIKKIWGSRVPADAATYIADDGLLFYDEADGELRLGDGVTPGGQPISVRADLIVANSLLPGSDNNSLYGLGDPTHRWWDLHIGDGGIYFNGFADPQHVPYLPGAQVDDIIPATDNGVSLGAADKRFSSIYLGQDGLYLADQMLDTNINITVDNGTLYIAGAQNLALGNLVIEDTTLKSADSALDISIGVNDDTGFFYVKRKAQFDNTTWASTEAMVSINGSGTTDPATIFPDTLIQTTSRPDKNSRIVQRSYGSSGTVGGDNSYAVWASFAARGNIASPSALKENDILARLSANGYGETTWGSGGGRVEFEALEDFTDTAKGTRINFWTTPEGQITSQNVASINSVGVVANSIQFTTDGSIQSTAGIPVTQKGNIAATQVATLGIDGKLDNSQIPSGLTGAVIFKGAWNANTNTPTLSDSLPAGVTSGWEYVVSMAGTRNIGDGTEDFEAGDIVIYDGTHWKRIAATNNLTYATATPGTHIDINNNQGTNETGVLTFTTDATPNSTANAIVSRDANGNFGAGTITATLVGSATSAGTAVTVTGNTQTAINQVGILTSLTVTGNVGAANLTGSFGLWGTIRTAAQPNITSVGTLGSLSVTGNVTAGNVSATNLTGTLLTAAQPNITSVGTLSALTVNNTTTLATANIGNINVGATGTVTTPRVIINDGGLRTINDGTAATIDFSTDSMVLWYRPSGTGTVTLANYRAGATVRLHINIGPTSRDINYGVASGINSSTGVASFNGSGFGSTDISDTTMQLVYTCYDGTAANTYVAVTTI